MHPLCLNGVMTTTSPVRPTAAPVHPAADHGAERDASYQMRVSSGQTVTARRDLLVSRHDGHFQNWEYGIIPAGTRFVVGCESNAGFRGIELSAHFPGGWHLSVSTGAVR